MTGTLFLDSKKHWKYSIPTSIGFRHLDVGRVTDFPTRDLAEARAQELLSREEATR